MRITSRLVLATGLTILIAAGAAAQTPPPTPSTEPPSTSPAQGEPTSSPATTTPQVAASPAVSAASRWIISANGGFQVISDDYDTSTVFDVFDEPASLTTSGELSSKPYFDGGVTYMVTEEYGVSAALSFYSSDSDVAVVARVPHPIFFDQIRTAEFQAADVGHRSTALHLNGVWFVPFTPEIDFLISAGPSLVFASQDVVTAANLRPEVPPFTDPQIDSVTVSSESATAFGFNAGVDMLYAITPRYGIGVNARYVFARADIEGLSDSLNVGGFQIGGGIRIRF